MPVPDHIHELLSRRDGSTRVALVGASNAPWKYGNIILRDLRRKGFTVVPIHPTKQEIAGLPAYPSVADAPGPIHIVDVVIPPARTLEMLRGLPPETNVWLQPGSFDQAVLDYAHGAFDCVIDDACIMVEAR